MIEDEAPEKRGTFRWKNLMKRGVETKEGASQVIVVAPNSNLAASFPSHSTPTPSPSS